MRTGISITVKPSDRKRLKAILKDRNAPQKHVWRAEIVLLSADGCGTNEIMRQTGKAKTCVWRWQERFMQEGVAGLLRDKTRPSRVAPLGPEVAARVVALTSGKPPGERTHWTGAMMAEACGISASAVFRIWRAHGLQPHKVKQFKLSNDPKFVEKLRDVVGLYVDPPAHAIVLSFDEKSQIQALDRTQPGLPMKKGRAGTMTHDYKRNGTTTLFAALDVLEGKVIGRCMQRHRHEEFIRFLNTINTEVPAGKMVHVILDNYAAHKHRPSWPGWRVTSGSASTSRPHPVPGLTPWRDILRNYPSSACSAASSVPSPSFKPPSTASSRRQTRRPSRLSGPPIRVKLSPPSDAGTKC
jgi:transposase